MNTNEYISNPISKDQTNNIAYLTKFLSQTLQKQLNTQQPQQTIIPEKALELKQLVTPNANNNAVGLDNIAKAIKAITPNVDVNNMASIADKLNNTGNQFKILNGINGNDAIMYNVQGLTKAQYDSYKAKGFDVSGLQKDTNGMYNGVLSQDKSFLQKYGGAINTGLAAGGLALGVAGYLQNKKMLNKQNKLLDEQIETSKANREHLTEEWDRVNNIRQKLNASY